MKKVFLVFILVISIISCRNVDVIEFVIASEKSEIAIYISEESDELIVWAVNDFADDIEYMTGERPAVIKSDSYSGSDSDSHAEPGSGSDSDSFSEGRSRKGIYVGKFDDELIKSVPGINSEEFSGQWEKFSIRTYKDNLILVGSDVRGVVYALFDVAERIGISPWKWWADVLPDQGQDISLILPRKGIISSPSVQYRGIFLNDEDWGLQPWAADVFEPETNDIGPKTYERIFQLLLRLKANTIWPAMHPCTKAFFTIPGNMEMAQKYNIVIGSSHAEPMLRNNVDEWNREERGEFNYFSNSDKVNLYWNERINQVKDNKNQFIVTLGMRGIHDSRMEGGASREEQVQALQTIISNQRNMLETTLEKPAETIPQVLVPYKEVLDLYNAGLEVPDDITLVWTDDNYGYIRRLSNEEEQKRSGGSGVYYHLSYWGRPHDYLWLSSTQPGLIWFEMSRAYQNDARKIWIANVGDIKPAEYNMEFFLDLAWDINMVNENNIGSHLLQWAAREFGKENASDIADLMEEYYRLAFLRKPEFMGWSQTEPKTPTRLTEFSISLNDNELQRRINNYQALVDKSDLIKTHIPENRLDAYFQLIEYNIKGAALMNFKFLYAQLAYLSGNTEEKEIYTDLSNRAYQEIVSLTHYYNNEMREGKWEGMMSMKPRNLAVYQMPDYHLSPVDSLDSKHSVSTDVIPIHIQACNYSDATGVSGFEWKAVGGLGYSNSGITLFPLTSSYFTETPPSLGYNFEIEQAGNYIIELRCLPTHSNNFDHSLTLQIDDEEPVEFKLNSKGRSEEWKTNVLRNYTSVKHPGAFMDKGTHRLTVRVNQTGIVLDQIAINFEGNEDYYEIPKTAFYQ